MEEPNTETVKKQLSRYFSTNCLMIRLMALEDERGVKQEVIRTIIIKIMGTSFFYNGSPVMRTGRV
jgi:hypothetical protein